MLMPNSFTIRAATEDERRFMYSGDMNQDECTGCIGHLRGDFGPTGTEFWTTWFPRDDNNRRTEEFRVEFDNLINTLRFSLFKEYGFLANRSAVSKTPQMYPGCDFIGPVYQEYGLRIDTENFIYLLRCNTARGDYNFYCYCYEKKRLSRHMGVPVEVDIDDLRSKPLAAVSLEDLQLSARTYNRLAHARIRTARDIQYMGREQLLSIRGMNSDLVDEVVSALEALGFGKYIQHLKEVP